MSAHQTTYKALLPDSRRFIPLFLALLILSLGCGRMPNRLRGRVAPDDPHLRYFGPVDLSNPKLPRFSWSGSGFEANFKGTRLTLLMANQSDGLDLNGDPVTNYYDVIIDRQDTIVLKVDNNRTVYPLFEDLSPGQHHLRIVKRTEALIGTSVFMGLRLGRLRQLFDLEEPSDLQLEFIGSSATCGYGVETDSAGCRFSAQAENVNGSYAGETARLLSADWAVFCYSGRGVSQNYDGTLVNTMPELYGRTRYDAPETIWKPENWNPQVVLVNLGAADFYAGVPDSLLFLEAYDGLLQSIRQRYPDTKIVLLSGPNPVDSGETSGELVRLRGWLDQVLARAEDRGDSELYRYDLAPTPEKDFGCDQQPNSRHQKQMGQELAEYLKGEILNWQL